MIDYLKGVTRITSKPAKKKSPKHSDYHDTVNKSGTGDSYTELNRFAEQNIRLDLLYS